MTSEAKYTETDLREAFKAGWKERNRTPGLKRATKRNLSNALLSQMGGGRFAEKVLIPDDRTYRHSIWLRSDFKRSL